MDNMVDDKIASSVRKVRKNWLWAMLGGGFLAVSIVAVLLVDFGRTSSSIPEESPATTEIQPEILENMRQQARWAIDNFDSKIAPMLQEPDLVRWKPAQVADLESNKQEALILYAGSDFASVIDLLEETSNMAMELKEQWLNDYERQLAEAKQLFAQNRINLSSSSLKKAQYIRSGQVETSDLQARIDVFPQVEQMLRDLQIAKKEGNYSKQAKLTENILQLDPARVELRGPLKQLKSQLHENAVVNLLKEGMNAVQWGDLSKARQFLHQVSDADPDRPEIKYLQQMLAKAEAKSARKTHFSQIKQAMELDNWLLASKLASQGIEQFGELSQLHDAKKLAREILTYQQKLNSFLQKPKRLQDDRIRAAAKKALIQVKPFGSHSPTLLKQSKRLEDILVNATIKIPVQFLSDGQTSIELVGLGQLGRFKKRDHSLSPGEYSLLGRCEGYKDQRLNFSISIDQSDAQVIRLVCDERI